MSSLCQKPLRCSETKMFLRLRCRGIQYAVVVLVAVVCGSSKAEHHHLARHKHYWTTNDRAIKAHDQTYTRKTVIMSPIVRWDKKSETNHTPTSMLFPTKPASIVPNRQTFSSDQYISLPKLKKNIIFDEFDYPSKENGMRRTFHDSFDNPVEGGSNEDVYKKFSMIHQQDLKKVEDADQTVSDVIDSIIDDDKSFNGGEDHRKSSKTTENISEDVEVAIEENTERDKNVQKGGEQNTLEDKQRGGEEEQQQQREQPKQLITPTPMQTTPKQEHRISKDDARQSWAVTLDTDAGIHSNVNAAQRKEEQNNTYQTEEALKMLNVTQSHLNDNINDPILLTAGIANGTKNPVAHTQQDFQDGVVAINQLLPKAIQDEITNSLKESNETIILENGNTSNNEKNTGGAKIKDKEHSGDISSITNAVNISAHQDIHNSVSVARDDNDNDYDYADMEKHGSDDYLASLPSHTSLHKETPSIEINNDTNMEKLGSDDLQGKTDHQEVENLSHSETSTNENNSFGDPDNVDESLVNNSKGFISSESSGMSSNVIDSNITSHDEEAPLGNKTSPAKFIHEHPIAFKILMEYFQNETSLQEKVRNKLKALPNALETENAMKKSLESVYELQARGKSSLRGNNKQSVTLRDLIKSLLQLAKKTKKAKKSKEVSKYPNKLIKTDRDFLSAKKKMAFTSRKPLLGGKGEHMKLSNKYLYATNAPIQAQASRKTDVALANNVESATKINVIPITEENRSSPVTQPSLDQAASMATTLGIMEDTIDKLLTQNEDFQGVPTTPSVKTDTSQLHTMDAKTILYKKRLKSLEISLSQDIFATWMYHFRSFEEMSIKPEQLRSGIASLGSIDRLARVVKKALRGEIVNIFIVGGSISAGGGLERDRHDVHGIYFRAFEEWWKKTVAPITASNLRMDVVAIGGTDSEYFSYCIKNYIKNPPDLVLWELAANDYRRYTGRNMDPAKPLEQLTRVLLTLPSHPAIIYVNFFRGDYYKTTQGQDCPDSEDEGGRLIAEYYKITSLSWRNVICSEIKQQVSAFTIKREYSPMTVETLFSSDGYHPSLLGHAQCATLLISYIRSVFEEVVSRELARIDKNLPEDDSSSVMNEVLPRPLYDDPANPSPMCWTLLTSDYHNSINNHLPHMRIIEAIGYEFVNITRWPVRTDRLRCLKANFPGATLKIKFFTPPLENEGSRVAREMVLISHNSFSGSATLWLDNDDSKQFAIIEPEGQRRTQVNLVSRDLVPGDHVINIRAMKPGFCVSGLAIL